MFPKDIGHVISNIVFKKYLPYVCISKCFLNKFIICIHLHIYLCVYRECQGYTNHVKPAEVAQLWEIGSFSTMWSSGIEFRLFCWQHTKPPYQFLPVFFYGILHICSFIYQWVEALLSAVFFRWLSISSVLPLPLFHIGHFEFSGILCYFFHSYISLSWVVCFYIV